MEIVKAILVIYALAAVGVLVVFLWRIAYFYEKTSGQRVGYYFLVVPALLMAAGFIWYLVWDVEFVGEPVGDLLLCAGGTLIFVFGFHLQELMTGEKR
jgi:hypothetical protein